MAVNDYDDSVEIVLSNVQKETLELTVHQKEALSRLWKVSLKRMREQKKPQSMHSGVNILSRFLNVQHHKVAVPHRLSSLAMQSFEAITNASPTTVSLPVFISLYLSSVCSSKCKSTYISPSRPSNVWSAPTTQEYCSDRYATVLLCSWVDQTSNRLSTCMRYEFDYVKVWTHCYCC